MGKTTGVDNDEDRLIITGASGAFGPSLLALLGSLDLNWPGHPRVRVYDIGLDDRTLQVLARNDIEVIRVPPFCNHWRKHFAWKIWCWNDAPARDVLWMDAAIVILGPIEEVFQAIKHNGYFVIPSYHPLTENASINACRGCDVAPSFREGKMTLAGGFVGFRKEGHISRILEEALSVASVEEYIASVEKMHRHDQMILSLLLYKYLGGVLMSDGIVYGGWLSPRQAPGQKVWVHRRSISPEDRAYFESHINAAGGGYMPRDPVGSRPLRNWWKKVFGAPERFFRRAIKGNLGKEEEPYNGIREK